jgi:RimJ/RimL family protein N-acetyltransferase
MRGYTALIVTGDLSMAALFETDLVTVRHLEPQDLAALVVLCADEETMAYAGGLPLTLEQTQLMLNNALQAYQEPGFGLFGIEWRETRQLIGFAGLSLRPDETGTADLMYAIAPAYRGHGLIAQALKPLLDYVFANFPIVRGIRHTITNPLDAPAMNLMSEIGMTLEKREEQETAHSLYYFVKEPQV